MTTPANWKGREPLADVQARNAGTAKTPVNELTREQSRALLAATAKGEFEPSPQPISSTSLAMMRRAERESKPKKSAPPTESAEQSALIVWFRHAYANLGLRDPRQLFSSQGGAMLGGRTGQAFARAARIKREGGQTGTPDLFLAHPIAPYGGLFIEMKRVRGGTLRPAQREIMAMLARCGYAVTVAKGAADAQTRIEAYVVGRHAEMSMKIVENSS